MHSADSSYDFVQYGGPELPEEPTVRRRIRKQAMRDVALARRRRGNYGKHNLRLLPVFVDGPKQDTSEPIRRAPELFEELDSSHNMPNTISEARPDNISRTAKANSFPRPVSLASVDMTPDAVLLLHMTPLTGLRLGVDMYSRTHITAADAQGSDILSDSFIGSRKLLSFIPSRYGHVSSLRHATDCVVAKVRQLVTRQDHSYPNGEALILTHYTKALRALQADLSDPNKWMKPETLCTAELLGAFEVKRLISDISHSRAQLEVLLTRDQMLHGGTVPGSWIRHVKGAARLIEARGPHRFNTDFEIALLLEHVGPSVMEAFFINTRCFLAEERWLRVLRTAIRNRQPFSDWAIALWEGLVVGPQAFRETADIVLSSGPVKLEGFDMLVNRMVDARERLLQWLAKSHPQSSESHEFSKRLDDGLSSTCPSLLDREELESAAYANQLALQGACLVSRMLKARLLYALAPARFHHLEMECQEQAERIMRMKEQNPNGEDGAIWRLFVSQSYWVAKGVSETKQTWSDGCQYREGMIEKWKFEEWCLSIGSAFALET